MPDQKIKLPKHFIFETQIPVRISDINYGRHVSHTAYIEMLHEARIQFLNQHGWSEMDVEGCGIIIASLQMYYKSQCYHGDTLLIQMGLGDISRTRCELCYLITKKEADVLYGATTLAFLDYGTSKLMRVPSFFTSLAN